MSWEAPVYLNVVERVHRENPGLIHTHLAFCYECVRELNKLGDGVWGVNGKRGNRNDISNDCVTRLNPSVPWGCSIVDIIGSADTPNPSPAWIDQTRKTFELGTVGLFIPVEGSTIPNPPVVKPPVVAPPAITREDLLRFQDSIDNLVNLVATLVDRPDINQDAIFNHVTSQAQGVLTGVTSEADRVIEAIGKSDPKCRLYRR